jgi:hypothetical protein
MNFVVNWAHVMLLQLGSLMTLVCLLLIQLYIVDNGVRSEVFDRLLRASILNLNLVALVGLVWWSGLPCVFLGDELASIDTAEVLGTTVFACTVVFLPVLLVLRYELKEFAFQLVLALMAQAAFLLMVSELRWLCGDVLAPLGFLNLIILLGISLAVCMIGKVFAGHGFSS